jgi:hypothetical protein
MRKLPLLLALLTWFASCDLKPSDDQSEEEQGFALVDAKEEEQELHRSLGVSVVKEYLRVFPDTALSDTSFLNHYHKIDDNGHKVRSAEYRIDGVMTSSTVNQFNEQGQKVAYSSINAAGEPKGRSEIVYNEEGHPSQVKAFDPADNHVMTIDFEYDPDSRQVIQHIKDHTGIEKSKLVFEVGENDRFSKCFITRQGKEYVQHLTYSEDGKLLEDLLLQGEDVIARTKYEYAANGLRQFKWLIGVEDNLEGIVEYRYEFYED